MCVPAEKRATKSLEPAQAQLKEQLTAMRTQRVAEVSNLQQHAKAMVVSAHVHPAAHASLDVTFM